MDINKTGSLVVVGTGISVAGQMTLVTRNHIIQADIVFVAIPNKPGIEFVKSLNPNMVLLTDLYEPDKPREQTYQQMMMRIVQQVQAGKKVCAAFYGHPGVFVDPSHQAIEHLQQKGYSVLMEPGISADACLIADLGIDPAAKGCQSYEATQFLTRRYVLDPHMTQIIWQVFCAGELTANVSFDNLNARRLLVNKLLKYYPAEHQLIIYEAKTSALYASRIEYCALNELIDAKLTAVTTLVFPSLGLPDFDTDMVAQLNLDCAALGEHEVNNL